MFSEYEIRANYTRDTITVYQAYSHAIADAALRAGRFVAPFSFQRMTWIKPSFLWLMYRSNWARKRGQERVLAVEITRTGWEQALSLAVLTSFDPSLFRSREEWRTQFQSAKVHLQWDTERTLRGASLPCYSIQIGISRFLIEAYVSDWVVSIEDKTSVVRKMQSLLQSGNANAAKRYLPIEKIYPIEEKLAKRLLIGK